MGARQCKAKLKALRIDQKVRLYRLFFESTGGNDLPDIQSVHQAKFVDMLKVRANGYHWSGAGQSVSLTRILWRAKSCPLKTAVCQWRASGETSVNRR